MADTSLTLQQLNILFQNLTMTMLGLSPTQWNLYFASLTAIKTANISATDPGVNYIPTDEVTISGGTGGTFIVDTVDVGGEVLTGHIDEEGTGYAVAAGLAVTGGTGTGLLIDITEIGTWVAAIPSNPYGSVRIAWQQEGAPAWKIDEDVTFLRCFEIDDLYNRQRDIETSDFDATTVNQEMSYTRVNSISWIFYGPNSYENAQTVRDQMFYPGTKLTLNQSNVYIVPDISAPTRAPELWQSQWWDRVDLIMHFNELVIRIPVVPAIASAPLEVHNKDGKVIDILIE